MITLTEEQSLELKSPAPLAMDPKTRETYVLVRQEAYERLKVLLDIGDFDPDEARGNMNEIMAEDDEKDPYLESYQH